MFESLPIGELIVDVLHDLPIRIYAKNPQGSFFFVNRTCARELGLSDPHEAIDKSDNDFFRLDLAEEWRREEADVLTTGEPVLDKWETEVWKDGRTSWAQTSQFPFRIKGEVVGLIGISKDITKLQLELEQNRQILDTVPSFIFVKVYDKVRDCFVFEFVNQAVADGFGCTKQNLLGKCDADFGHDPQHVAQFRLIDERVYRTGISELVRQPSARIPLPQRRAGARCVAGRTR